MPGVNAASETAAAVTAARTLERHPAMHIVLPQRVRGMNPLPDHFLASPALAVARGTG